MLEQALLLFAVTGHQLFIFYSNKNTKDQSQINPDHPEIIFAERGFAERANTTLFANSSGLESVSYNFEHYP